MILINCKRLDLLEKDDLITIRLGRDLIYKCSAKLIGPESKAENRFKNGDDVLPSTTHFGCSSSSENVEICRNKIEAALSLWCVEDRLLGCIQLNSFEFMPNLENSFFHSISV